MSRDFADSRATPPLRRSPRAVHVAVVLAIAVAPGCGWFNRDSVVDACRMYSGLLAGRNNGTMTDREADDIVRRVVETARRSESADLRRAASYLGSALTAHDRDAYTAPDNPFLRACSDLTGFEDF